jgi:ribosomal protein L19E
MTEVNHGRIEEKAVSRAQQRFFGMVRAAQKGEMENPSSEVSKVATSISKSDVKKFAKTKHKGLPDKVEVKEMSAELRNSVARQTSGKKEKAEFRAGGGYAAMTQKNQSLQQVRAQGRKNFQPNKFQAPNVHNYSVKPGTKTYAGNPSMTFKIEGRTFQEFMKFCEK